MTKRNLLPDDPTRPMRKLAIRNSIDRVRNIMRSVSLSETSSATIADQAQLRIDLAKSRELP